MQDFATRWSAIKSALVRKADEMEYNAGMSGSMSDGGANVLRANIAMFEAGMAHRIPAEWDRIAAPLLDPEYADYQRLKAKFERR